MQQNKVLSPYTLTIYKDIGLLLLHLCMVMPNAFVARTQSHWPDFVITGVNLYSYGDANMHVEVVGVPEYSTKLLGEGKLVFKADSGELVFEKDP